MSTKPKFHPRSHNTQARKSVKYIIKARSLLHFHKGEELGQEVMGSRHTEGHSVIRKHFLDIRRQVKEWIRLCGWAVESHSESVRRG